MIRQYFGKESIEIVPYRPSEAVVLLRRMCIGGQDRACGFCLALPRSLARARVAGRFRHLAASKANHWYQDRGSLLHSPGSATANGPRVKKSQPCPYSIVPILLEK